jgi:nucleotide-binding universal stress UspA family protein
MILCAVDDSEAAGRVLDSARWLAGALQAPLVVVHVVKQTPDDADALVASIRGQVGDELADVRLVEGSPAEAIMETAEREDAELLVVGSRGRGPLRAALLGSVSHELTAQARCPVVVVPSGAAFTAPSGPADGADASVVCGVDGSDEALAGVAYAGGLSSRLGYRLVVVHARQNVRAMVSYPGARSATPPATGQGDAVGKLADEVVERAVQASGVPATGVLEPGPPAEVLQTVADREAGRLIVITARGVGRMRAAVLGSVAAELTESAPCPVVVLSESAIAGSSSSPA